MKPAKTESYCIWRFNEFPKIESTFLEELCKEISSISIYDVVHKETHGHLKTNLQGIYIHTYKTNGKTQKQMNDFNVIADKIYDFLKGHEIRVFDKRPTKNNAYLAYYFWVKNKES